MKIFHYVMVITQCPQQDWSKQEQSSFCSSNYDTILCQTYAMNTIQQYKWNKEAPVSVLDNGTVRSYVKNVLRMQSNSEVGSFQT